MPFKSFECNLCHKMLADKRNLDRHLEFAHQGMSEGKKRCGVCQRLFKNQPSLDHHYRQIHKMSAVDGQALQQSASSLHKAV